jgi:hypothetical protein
MCDAGSRRNREAGFDSQSLQPKGKEPSNQGIKRSPNPSADQREDDPTARSKAAFANTSRKV